MVGSLPPPYHGGTIYFHDLLHSDITRRFEVSHVDTSDHRNLDNLGRFDPTNVYLALRSIARLLITGLRFKPELVYLPISSSTLPFLRDALLIWVSKIALRTKVVVHLHGGFDFRTDFFDQSRGVMKSLIKTILRLVDGAVVLAENLRPIFRGLVRDVYVAPNGINVEGINMPVREDRTQEQVVVGWLSNIRAAKGILDLAQAAAIIKIGGLTPRFRLAGSWRRSEEHTKDVLNSYLDAKGLCESFEFVGSLTGHDKWKFLCECDIFVLPSHSEGFPISLIEAMWAGCAVIATDVGAVSEIIDHGINGMIVEKKQPARLAEALKVCIEQPGFRSRLAIEGKKSVFSRFTKNHNVASIIHVFDQVLSMNQILDPVLEISLKQDDDASKVNGR